MIEKVLGVRKRAADRRPVVTSKDNVALCAQAKVRMQTRFLGGFAGSRARELHL
jgi:hypothetical protein